MTQEKKFSKEKKPQPQPKQGKSRKKESQKTSSEIKPTTQQKSHLQQLSHPKVLIKLVVVATVLAVLACALGLYSWSTSQRLFQQLQQSQMLLQNVQESTQKNQSQLRESAAIVGRLQNFKIANKQSWILIEVTHLLRLAQYNLRFSGDIATTLTLLNTAQRRLAALNTPRTLPLRQAVANNIEALQAIPKLDLAGLLVKLDALTLRVEKLPLLVNRFEPAPHLTTTSKREVVTGWRKYWDKTLDTLGRVIVIRHQTNPVAPLITPSQQANLIHTLQIKLSQANWAVLHRNEAVYKLSLEQSSNWITQYFASTAASTKSFLMSLDELKKISIEPEYPDLTPTIMIADHLLHHPIESNQQKRGDKKSSPLKTDSKIKTVAHSRVNGGVKL